jgi:DNA-binding FadR family transcriptional regulator
MQREPIDFTTVMLDPVLFSLASGETTFAQLSCLRQVVESGFWDQAVVMLTAGDKEHLSDLIASAWSKLRGDPVHIPNSEHRDLHLTIFRRLENPFVQGILETYWEAYEAIELTRFAQYRYWLTVWDYHERIVEALLHDDYPLGRRLLLEHFELLRPLPTAAADPPGTAPGLLVEVH